MIKAKLNQLLIRRFSNFFGFHNILFIAKLLSFKESKLKRDELRLFFFLLKLRNSIILNITIQNPIIQIIKITRPMRTEMPYNQNGTAFSSLITIFEQATVLTLFSLSNGLSSCIPSLRIIFACDFMSTFSQSAKSLK